MGDFGKGLKSFKKSMKEDDEAPAEGTAERKAIDAEQADKPSQTATAEKDQAAS